MRRRWLVFVIGFAALPAAGWAANDPTAAGADLAGDPVIAAAGDIACRPGQAVTASACRQRATAALLPGADRVLTLGDNQYDSGLLNEYQGSYDPTWGQYKAETAPVPGNHEYRSGSAAGYFTYFGALAGTPSKSWYSYDLGTWHLIALNSTVPMNQGSPQNVWLEADLAAHPAACTLAYWHYPLYSAGGYAPGIGKSRPVWVDLLRARADLVLNGHEHHYERWAPMDQSGQPSATGIREIVVGTGGKAHGSVVTPGVSGLEAFDGTHFGVLRVTLRPRSYQWAFTGEGGAVLDSGTTTCV